MTRWPCQKKIHLFNIIERPCSRPNMDSKTTPENGPADTSKETVFDLFRDHSSAKRTDTALALMNYLHSVHPGKSIAYTRGQPCDLVTFANDPSINASITPLYSETDASSLVEYRFIPATSRLRPDDAFLIKEVRFATFHLEWEGCQFAVYRAEWVEHKCPQSKLFFALLAQDDNVWRTSSVRSSLSKMTIEESPSPCYAVIFAFSKWNRELHEEVWVYDAGLWVKSGALYRDIQNTSWADVVLPQESKRSLEEDVLGFFSSKSTYEAFAVPWKRGILFHGKPGNGKTLSIKALANMLSDSTLPVKPSVLYIKTFASSSETNEYAIRHVFTRARSTAPCVLVFEDVDSLVNDKTRSYFLNEIDGLESNDGILMIGSTNHLDKLDPGLSKRPSRFDRKYAFLPPSTEQRRDYAELWRAKLEKNMEIDFPMKLCDAFADMTEGFSYAYLKEAFVASLLAHVRCSNRANRSGQEGVQLPLTVHEDQVAEELEGNAFLKILHAEIPALRREMADADARPEPEKADRSDRPGRTPSQRFPASLGPRMLSMLGDGDGEGRGEY